MHPDEVDIERPLVGRLIATQFPQWADLPLAEVRSAGTDNAIYRLGEDLAVRLPRLPKAAATVDREQRWLPVLRAGLPLAIPEPLGRGEPDDDFPFPWSVYRWIDGESVADARDVDLRDLAGKLGRFVAALRDIDTTGGPSSLRAGPLDTPAFDDEVRMRIRELSASGKVDADLATAAWEEARATPAWDGPPAWVHGDLLPTNLLVRRARLAAVIDFGGLGVGDPACDLLPAWALLTAQTREVFRAEAGVDDHTWARGRGWALGLGLGAVHVYAVTNPALGSAGAHAVTEILADHRRTT